MGNKILKIFKKCCCSVPLSFHPLNFGHSSPTVLSHRVSQHFTMLQAKATTFVVIKCDQQCFNCFFCFVKKDRPLVTVCDNFVTICVPSFSQQLLLFSLVKKVSLVLTSYFYIQRLKKVFESGKRGRGKMSRLDLLLSCIFI